MILWSDNKGVVNITNSWTTGGNTYHTATKCFFLIELKEAGLIEVRHMQGTKMGSDIFTKFRQCEIPYLYKEVYEKT